MFIYFNKLYLEIKKFFEAKYFHILLLFVKMYRKHYLQHIYIMIFFVYIFKFL